MMTKPQKELARLASILDLMLGEDEDQADAAKSLDELRQDLVAMGFDVKQVLEAVGTPVERWLNKCGVEVEEEESSPRGASTAGFTAVAPVERWTPQVVQMAFHGQSRAAMGQLIANVPQFQSFKLEPYLMIGITPAPAGCNLLFVVEDKSDRMPGRRSKPGSWQLEVHLFRDTLERAVAEMSYPRLFVQVPLPDYATGEESDWKVKIRLRRKSPHRKRTP